MAPRQNPYDCVALRANESPCGANLYTPYKDKVTVVVGGTLYIHRTTDSQLAIHNFVGNISPPDNTLS